jgi:hypothetical protein
MKKTNYYTLTPYVNHQIEDYGGYISEDFKTFARKWHNFLKRMCVANGWQLPEFNTGHYYCSWFVKNGEKYAYCSFSDVRHFSTAWYKSILYRTAQNESDYTGGANRYSDLQNLENNLRKILN